LIDENRPLRRCERDSHDDKERNSGEAGEQAQQHQAAADNLEGADEWPEELRHRQADRQEAAGAELIGKRQGTLR